MKLQRSTVIVGIFTVLAVFGLLFTACTQSTGSGSEHSFDSGKPYNPGSKTFTVTFNNNGGSTVDSQVIYDGEKITEPQGVTKEGHTMEGWYTEATFITKWNFAMDTVTKNITLHAKWTKNPEGTFTVTFNNNGGSVVTSQTISDGKKATEPQDVTRTGYNTLDGWYTEATFITKWDFAINTITRDITLYARWVDPISYTITFNSNGGSMVDSITGVYGSIINKPADPIKDDLSFGGWYKEAELTNQWNFTIDTVTGNITLHAAWLTEDGVDFGLGAIISNTFNVSNSSEWDDAVYIIKNSGHDKNYIINVIGSFDVTGFSGNSYTFGSTRVKVSIRGEGQTLSLPSFGSSGNILRTTNYQTIILRGLTLLSQGGMRSLVYVEDGTVIMHDGKITGSDTTSGQTNSRDSGGGVYLYRGTFIMYSGEISGNTSRFGGGVYVNGFSDPFHGTFTMYGGKISGNTGSEGLSDSSGGGVFVNGYGTFTMYGGEISGNDVSGRTSAYGGGVYVNNMGAFYMHGGEIVNNTVSSNTSAYGSGVYVNGPTSTSLQNFPGSFRIYGGRISGNTNRGVYMNYGHFYMYGGEISGNDYGVYVNQGRFYMDKGEISGNTGDGVYYLSRDYTFTMDSGKIFNNTGNGVYLLSNGYFTMNGGEIFGNTGSGVYVAGTFRISNGTIYGSNEGTKSNGAAEGAALYRASSGTAQYYSMSSGTWNILLTTNNTIRVEGGERLQ
jgi:uncharacterized repeat protein (TIGR02543 family)